MQPSPRALAFVQGFERLRLVGYLPTPDDKPTIGWGHTGPEVYVGLVWTRAQADAAWDADVAYFVTWLNKQLYGIPTTQGQFDALFSLVYNIGVANLRTSTLLRKHKLGDHAGAAAEFEKWDHQNHKVLNGLLKRRLAERALYLS
jgi:GH24 family phage-related lysozyme (muramidase)